MQNRSVTLTATEKYQTQLILKLKQTLPQFIIFKKKINNKNIAILIFRIFLFNYSLRRHNHIMITQKCQTIFDIHISNQKENRSFPFDTLWKN